MEYKFIDNHVEITPPKRTKKMTATRFASVLGLNAWSTPFQMFCQITKLYEPPFEDNMYMQAGRVIEPKICDYLKARYFMDIKSPTDVYGENYFQKTWGDFFKDQTVFGGMWDFIGDDFIVEVKTTKRAEDWLEDVPIYYKLQAALYAYLLGFNHVVMTASFLNDADYITPENFTPSVENTKIYEFDMSETFPDFEERYIEPALEWWKNHIETGISPDFDEKKDAEYLKALRKNTVTPEADEVKKLIAKADRLQASVDLAESKIADKKAELKEIDDQIKKYMSEQYRDGDKKVEIEGKKYRWTLTRSNRQTFDKDKAIPVIEAAGLAPEDFYKTNITNTLKKTLMEE